MEKMLFYNLSIGIHKRQYSDWAHAEHQRFDCQQTVLHPCTIKHRASVYLKRSKK
jgi:hypothetical protein